LTASGPHVSRWRPILEGAAASEARAIARAIGESLQHRTGEDRGGAALGASQADRALFFSYLALADQAGDRSELAARCLEEAFHFVATTTLGPDLFGGFTSVAWVMQHLAGAGMSGAVDVDSIDEALEDLLEEDDPEQPFDLLSGLAGFGVYFLEQLPGVAARRRVTLVVDRLARTAVEDGPGLTWRTPPSLLPLFNQDPRLGHHYNVGVSHGVGGVLGFLAGAHAAEIAPARTGPLIEGAARWVLAQKLPPPSPSRYPAWVIAERGAARPTRLAWCYGDIGLAAALLVASRATGDGTLRREAIELGCDAARRSVEHTGVADAGLCHGASGIAHLFNRMFQATGVETLREASVRWFDHLIRMPRPRDDGSLLLGDPGVALALLAAATPVEPGWDRIFVASTATIPEDRA
jgi:lantibiotic modifying enzyme